MGVLGLNPSEFWRMTPRQFHRVIEERMQKEQANATRDDYRAGVLASVVANAWLKKGDGGRWDPHDFFGTLEPPEPVVMSPEEILARFRSQFGHRITRA